MFQCKVRPCFYPQELIGSFIPYLIVDDTVIVDPKMVSCFTDRRIAQMIRYLNLNITRLNLALLINSKNARFEWKRVSRPQEPHPKYFWGSNPQLHTSPGIFSSI